jgi:arylsulfatase A-like enzyme/alpha-L-fucosidase
MKAFCLRFHFPFPVLTFRRFAAYWLVFFLFNSTLVNAQGKYPAPYGVLPTELHLPWHEMELYVLIHFTPTTFENKEWGYGDADPSIFNPTHFDAQQIVDAAQAGGFKGVVFVAKHHDGFCLWPTKTTDYNISKSPWRNGKGDMVREMQQAAAQRGMKFGLYCSPWDRNHPQYGKPEYTKVYQQQLKELYTQYGDLFLTWFDGANGGDGYYGGAREKRNIDRIHYYQWDTITKMVRTLQPKALMFSDVGDVRWVGNERGEAGLTSWATFTPLPLEGKKIAVPGAVQYEYSPEGTRNGKFWKPAECDVPLRPGWFYHPEQDNQVKSAHQLFELYLKSVGRGACLDMGLAPDKSGKLHPNDVQALADFGKLLKKVFSTDMAKTANITVSNIRGENRKLFPVKNLVDDDPYSYWATDDHVTQPTVELSWATPQRIDLIRLRENIKLGQRIEKLMVEVWENQAWKVIDSATSIGFNRIIALAKPVTTQKLRIRITQSPAAIVLSEIGVFCSRQKPNIVYMMSDDHGYQAISAYGHGLNNTPHIDALAKKGMLFRRAFVTNSICGPSRAVMLTGKHSHVNGFKDNHSRFNGDQPTVAKYLQQAGYQTALVGKWHLGSTPQGFDYWNILPGQGDYYQPDFIENGVKKRVSGYVTNLTTDFALEWLKNRDTSRPFFLVYQQKAPHRNWMPEEKYFHLFDSTSFPLPNNLFDDYQSRSTAAYQQEMSIAMDMHEAYDLKLRFDLSEEELKGLGKTWQSIYNRFSVEQKKKWEAAYRPIVEEYQKISGSSRDVAIWKYQRYLRDYLRCVQSVDDNVGRLLNYLRDNGLEENTIIIYTSDQGFFLGEHGWFDKRFMYEESFRTPLIIKWPGITQQQIETHSLVQNLDFAPTILEMAELPIPQDMQGKSMVPVLNGTIKTNLHEALYYHFYENQEHKVAKHIGIRTQRYKMIWFYENKEWEWYDLETDPNEMNNLYGQPHLSTLQKELQQQLRSLAEKYKDPIF